MMLQAADLGLGTTYIGMFDPVKLQETFPEELSGLTPIAVLALGYPAEGARPSRLHADRKPLETLVRSREKTILSVEKRCLSAAERR